MSAAELDLKKRKLSEAIELYRSQEGLTYQDLADLLNISYLKLKRWADGISFPRQGSDLDTLCSLLKIDKTDLLKVPSVRDQIFHSLDSLLKEYAELVDPAARTRVFLLVVSVVYARLLQLPNTNLVVKQYDGDSSSVSVPTEAVFFNNSSFGLFGSHDVIKYYIYSAEDHSPELRLFNSSVLDSFVK